MDVAAPDGFSLWVEESGVGSPLVLVHGSGVDATTWEDVIGPLSDRHRVITYDRRGYGRSSHPPVRDLRVHGHDLGAVLAALGERAHVLGWSSGGNVVLQAAVQSASGVRSMIVYEPPFRSRRGADLAGLRMVFGAKFEQLRGRKQAGAARIMRWATRTRDGGNGFDRLSDDHRVLILGHSDVLLAEIDPHLHGVTADHLSVDAVAALPVPLRWAFGSESVDWYQRLAQPVIERRLGLPTVVVEGAGHQPHLEAPEAFVDMVLAATAD